MLALPICLYDEFPTAHWLILPVSLTIAFFLIGIEELGNLIEEPFSILPLEAMVGEASWKPPRNFPEAS